MLLRPLRRQAFSTKIYTKKGDTGLTVLLKSPHEQISKTAPIFTVLGDNDELSSIIGLARFHSSKHHQLHGLSSSLLQIQKHLQNLNSHLAAPKRSFNSASAAAELEALIDCWTAEMPELTAFLLPGGSECGAVLQLARAVCRRAERSFFALSGAELQGAEFLNRLSDFLFTAARYSNYKLQVPDITFK